MKIITWNCGGAFRKKYPSILKYSPDICIVQECRNLYQFSDKDYQLLFPNFKWIGRNKNKGIGIFCLKKNSEIHIQDWNSHGIDYFVKFCIDGIPFIAVWACNNYIEDAYTYFSIHLDKLTNNFIICGDFNSSSIWDDKLRHRIRNHAALVNLFNSVGLNSIYHHKRGLMQGKELDPTFYLYRDRNKPFHIDYVFCKHERVCDFEIGTYEDWINLSDHMPIIFTCNAS